ncbi:MarR family winged helix-turn-helix transcriptional regulator [Streptomyces sp. NPDC088725]|uniref:MarR family winged helix-turn-helix transcriptional regulator n=1 Tax=Streptomyces sp. NPDC088725 TaxID=3365873 RepID=UPI0037F3931D
MTDDATNETSRETGADADAGAVGELGFHLKVAEQAIMARKAELLRGLDLTVPQCRTLAALMGGLSKSCTQLAREALVTSQTMTTNVSKLETKGLVERRMSPDHGRVVLVSLTSSGVERARAAHRLSAAVERDVWDAFSAGDRSLLLAMLNRVVEVAPAAGPEAGTEAFGA